MHVDGSLEDSHSRKDGDFAARPAAGRLPSLRRPLSAAQDQDSLLQAHQFQLQLAISQPIQPITSRKYDLLSTADLGPS